MGQDKRYKVIWRIDMGRQQYIAAAILISVMVFSAGCGVAVKDTAGIKKYFEEQGRAEMLAIELKANTPDKNSADYKNAEKLYNRAAGAGNGWTSGIVFEARTERKIDVSLEDYADSEAGKALAKFLELGGPDIKYFDPVTTAAIANFALALIDKIEQQNNQRVERVVKQLEQEFSRSRWTAFENTTVQWIDEKYKFKSSDR